jgi:hypothetical protein
MAQSGSFHGHLTAPFILNTNVVEYRLAPDAANFQDKNKDIPASTELNAITL